MRRASISIRQKQPVRNFFGFKRLAGYGETLLEEGEALAGGLEGLPKRSKSSGSSPKRLVRTPETSLLTGENPPASSETLTSQEPYQ
jgi:hypothetical protein